MKTDRNIPVESSHSTVDSKETPDPAHPPTLGRRLQIFIRVEGTLISQGVRTSLHYLPNKTRSGPGAEQKTSVLGHTIYDKGGSKISP